MSISYPKGIHPDDWRLFHFDDFDSRCYGIYHAFPIGSALNTCGKANDTGATTTKCIFCGIVLCNSCSVFNHVTSQHWCDKFHFPKTLGIKIRLLQTALILRQRVTEKLQDIIDLFKNVGGFPEKSPSDFYYITMKHSFSYTLPEFHRQGKKFNFIFLLLNHNEPEYSKIPNRRERKKAFQDYHSLVYIFFKYFLGIVKLEDIEKYYFFMELLSQCKVELLRLFLSKTKIDRDIWDDKDVLRILKKRNCKSLGSLKYTTN